MLIGDRQVFSTPEACVPLDRPDGLPQSVIPFMRIVSLLPSTTEIVCALSLETELVGITHECDYPEAITDRPRLTASRISHETMTSKEIDHAVRSQLDGHGSIYDLDEKRLRELNPDLILTQELCDVCAVSYKIVARPRARSKLMSKLFRSSRTRLRTSSRTFVWWANWPAAHAKPTSWSHR